MYERILVVEDERSLNQMIVDYLVALGYGAESAYDGLEALRKVETRMPDFVVLDLQLPGLDGLDVARRIRERSSVPIIMLTARAEEADKLIGLEIGADDYLTKPFSMKELAARIRTVLRRSRPPGQEPIRSGEAIIAHLDIRLDTGRRIVTRGGTAVSLTVVQFNILRVLLDHPGQVLTRLQILEAAEGINQEGYERTIDVHVKNIRKALEPDPARPTYILTEWGVGYRMAERIGTADGPQGAQP
jgi:DNA-binding response OmpR family regulator